MSEFKDRCFSNTAGTIPANVGDKVGLILNTEMPTANKLRFYTIVFNYGNDGQRYLSDDKVGLCFVDGDRYSMKIYTDYDQAKQVMEELTKTSFSNEGILQVCSLEFNTIGELSKGNPEFTDSFITQA